MIQSAWSLKRYIWFLRFLLISIARFDVRGQIFPNIEDYINMTRAVLLSYKAEETDVVNTRHFSFPS